jgi:tRNA(fMet)-specific endonuclease VapC
MKYLLDTNTCVFFLRGKLALGVLIKEKGRENFFISEITVAELRYGLKIALILLKCIKQWMLL